MEGKGLFLGLTCPPKKEERKRGIERVTIIGLVLWSELLGSMGFLGFYWTSPIRPRQPSHLATTKSQISISQ